jgi:flagellar basal-body rod protein FlgC
VKTTLNFGFDISAKGMSIQRRKMNIIAENIANSETTRTQNGEPYKKKFIEVIQKEGLNTPSLGIEGNTVRLNITNKDHISTAQSANMNGASSQASNLGYTELEDKTPGELVYMPDHPNANEKGYVEMSNVNVVNEMVDMIAASRGYEANSTALGASKQIAKDSLDI